MGMQQRQGAVSDQIKRVGANYWQGVLKQYISNRDAVSVRIDDTTVGLRTNHLDTKFSSS